MYGQASKSMGAKGAQPSKHSNSDFHNAYASKNGIAANNTSGGKRQHDIGRDDDNMFC